MPYRRTLQPYSRYLTDARHRAFIICQGDRHAKSEVHVGALSYYKVLGNGSAGDWYREVLSEQRSHRPRSRRSYGAPRLVRKKSAQAWSAWRSIDRQRCIITGE